jgi:hypothetical protein
MPQCDECNALLGEPVRVPPHTALMGGDVKTSLHGIVEMFKCGACGAHWERPAGGRFWRDPVEVWRRL